MNANNIKHLAHTDIIGNTVLETCNCNNCKPLLFLSNVGREGTVYGGIISREKTFADFMV